MDGLELSAVIAKLRASLSEAQKEGEGQNLRFLIDDIEVELNVAVEDKGSVGGGVKFYVLSAKADVSQKQTATQKIKLKLKVRDEMSTQPGGETLVASTRGARAAPPPPPPHQQQPEGL